MVALKRSPLVPGGVYQSVMITPPKGSAEASGMNEIVSNAPRHRNALTPMPEPPPPAVPRVLSFVFLPNSKRVPLSLPPARVVDGSPGEPLPSPPKSAGVGFGLMAADEQPATASATRKAMGRKRMANGVGRIAMESLSSTDSTVVTAISVQCALQSLGIVVPGIAMVALILVGSNLPAAYLS